MNNFSEVLADAQTALRAKVASSSKSQNQERKLAQELYRSGQKVGLTSKEITKVLMKAVAGELRPGLARPK